ncbi:hypothetical protein LTR56_007125 [Elasticomyces elasticus]|nr:hypothetical protein LTR22_020454 [Elasticomyces elasticus]KAK3648993.1 hypothetical protein LTR56_007125 [Elasticomyces elasticus]KAK4917807.1 hypothetical protein LTR49_014344 [Elasticomyces elasticus]KAK5750479.1 hypothetical protein LTS12_019437 [Elasticomyces elasticus]
MRQRATFVAISHLWADGLGNTEAHAVPNCQLERIIGYATSIKPTSREWAERGTSYQVQPPKKSRFTKESAQILLWLDVYCVPLPRDRRAAKLKSQAMEQMPLVYSRSSAVLVLDKELEVNDADIWKDLHLWLRISAYYRRFWTLPEAALAAQSGLYVVCGKQVVRVPSSVQHHFPTYTENDPRQKSMRWALGLKQDQSGPESYRSLRLVAVWNGLLGKTSTKRGELHAILANLLDISATRVLALAPLDRMKAILGNYKYLPLDLVLSASARQPESTTLNDQMQEVSKDEDRWLPFFPEANLPRIRLFMEHGEPPPHQGPFVLADHNTWVEVLQSQDYRPPLASGQAFYLLHAHPEPASYASRGYQGNGARLILQHITQDSQDISRYSFVFDRPLIFGLSDARSQELQTHQPQVAVEELEDRPTIIFACGEKLQVIKRSTFEADYSKT